MSADPIDTPISRAGWVRDRNGVLRRAPERHRALQVELCAALAAVGAGKAPRRQRIAPEAPEPTVVEYSDAEMLAAADAYTKARAGTGPALTDRETAALRAHWALEARARKGRGARLTTLMRTEREPTAVEQIIAMIDEGMTLEAIAEKRGCLPRAVIKRLQEAGLRDIADELRAPSRPVRVVERVPGVQSKTAEEIARMAGEGMTLAAIAEARGCKPKSIVNRLREAGRLDVIEHLRRPGAGSPIRVNEGDGTPTCEPN